MNSNNLPASIKTKSVTCFVEMLISRSRTNIGVRSFEDEKEIKEVKVPDVY